jgi:hypothetical protein
MFHRLEEEGARAEQPYEWGGQVSEVAAPRPEAHVAHQKPQEEGRVYGEPWDEHAPEQQEAAQRLDGLLVVHYVLAEVRLYELEVQEFVDVVLGQAGAAEPHASRCPSRPRRSHW